MGWPCGLPARPAAGLTHPSLVQSLEWAGTDTKQDYLLCTLVPDDIVCVLGGRISCIKVGNKVRSIVPGRIR